MPRWLLFGLLLGSLPHVSRLASPDGSGVCPGFGTDADDQLCGIWQQSVASIPYDVPWTEDNRALLQDSIMRHCRVPGVVADRPCCASLSEWSCRGFSESRARLHSSILQALLPDPRTRETSGITHPDAPPPLLVLTVGVPGTGKSAALRALADALLSPASLLPEGVRGERREAGRGTGNGGDASAGLHTGMGAGEGTLPTAQAIRRAAAAAGFVWGDGVSFDSPGSSPAGNQGPHGHSHTAQQRGKCYVACDDVKLLLAQPDKDERSPQPGTTSSSECSGSAVGAGDGAGGGIPAPGSQPAAAGTAGVAAPVGEDALSARVRRVNLMANETRPLVHSQYLHRESIYLADELFGRCLSRRHHIIMEKIMSSVAQVMPYIEIARKSAGPARAAGEFNHDDKTSGGESAGRDSAQRGQGLARQGYRVIILASVADWERAFEANRLRRRSGHVVTPQQMETQHERYARALAELRSGINAGGKNMTGVGLVILKTDNFLSALARGEPLSAAQALLTVDYIMFK